MALTKEQLSDRSKFQFQTEDVELPELGGGKIVVRQLSVAQQLELSNLVDENGRIKTDLDTTAQVFVAAVVEPEVTIEEAKQFLPDWPAPALERVMDKFNELVGDEEELRAAADEFRGPEQRP